MLSDADDKLQTPAVKLGKLKDRLGTGIIIFDGAMGTEIYRRNFFVNASYEQLCLSSPDTIRDIHRAYIEAGADIIETNTFSANRISQKEYRLEARAREVALAGARSALTTAGAAPISATTIPTSSAASATP